MQKYCLAYCPEVDGRYFEHIVWEFIKINPRNTLHNCVDNAFLFRAFLLNFIIKFIIYVTAVNETLLMLNKMLRRQFLWQLSKINYWDQAVQKRII